MPETQEKIMASVTEERLCKTTLDAAERLKLCSCLVFLVQNPTMWRAEVKGWDRYLNL